MYKSDIPQVRPYTNPGMEVVYHFTLYKGINLGTGIGFESGHYRWNKEYASVRVVDGQLRKYEGVYDYNFRYFSLVIPVSIELQVPSELWIFSDYLLGANFGWHTHVKYWIENVGMKEAPVYNRYYIEPYFGFRIHLVNLKKMSLNLQPYINYRYYTTDKNDWQQNHFFVGLSICSLL